MGARITLVASAAAAVGLALPGVLPAAAGGHGAASSPARMVTMPTLGRAHTTSRVQRTSNMSYRGGPVETAPAVYISWWGTEWSGSGFSTGGYSSAQAQAYTTDYFGNVGGSGWDNINSQYCQGVAVGTINCGASGAHIANSVGQLAGTWNDTTPVPSSPSQSDIAAAAARLEQHFNYNANATYFVYTPSGKSMSGFATSWCAWHSLGSSPRGTIAYAYMPYQPDAGTSCGENFVNATNTTYGNGYFDGFSVVGGHEYAEALTDPLPSSGTYAWTDSRGSETGDKCAWSSSSTDITLTVGTTTHRYAVQPLWSNANSGCVTSF